MGLSHSLFKFGFDLASISMVAFFLIGVLVR